MKPNDAWSAVAELAASQHGSFHRRQAAKNGLTNKRLDTAQRRGQLRRVFRDVFVLVGAPPTWRQSLMVHSLNEAVASHRSAAALHRLDGCAEGIVEISRRRSQPMVPYADGAPRDVKVHRNSRLNPEMVTTVDGIQCTTVAVTLVDLGAVVGPARVEQALDSALRQGYSISWIGQTLDQLHRPGPSGSGTLVRLLNDPARAGGLPDSWFERSLSKKLVAHGLPRPTLQHTVGSRRLDISYPAAKLAIEAHSRRFHFGRQETESDHRREMELVSRGWLVIYVTWAMASEPAELASQISRLYFQRLAESQPNWSA